MMATVAIKVRKTKMKEKCVRRINVANLKVSGSKAAFQLEFRRPFLALEQESVKSELSSFH